MATVTLGHRAVGDGEPCFIIAEIGINHNGDLDIAKKLINAAAVAGCDAVKFQKRTPELCVPPEQRGADARDAVGRDELPGLPLPRRVRPARSTPRSTRYCRAQGIAWFASCWDEPSVDFIEQFDRRLLQDRRRPRLTDDDLLRTAPAHRPAGDPVDRHVDDGGDPTRRGAARSRAVC